jgi:hypothetical protein
MRLRGLACTVFAISCAAEPDDGDTGAGSSSNASTAMATMAESSTATTDDTAGTEASPACISALEEADAFVMLFGMCNEDADCTSFNGFCYPLATCGGVAINAGADENEWNALHTALETECGNCGADPCGACAVCDPVGTCRLTLECPSTGG